MDLVLWNGVPDFRQNRLVHCHVGLENGWIAAVSGTPMEALEVIPHPKLTDRGLFDVNRFQYVVPD